MAIDSVQTHRPISRQKWVLGIGDPCTNMLLSASVHNTAVYHGTHTQPVRTEDTDIEKRALYPET